MVTTAREPEMNANASQSTADFRIRPRAAWRALQRLIADPTQTEQVFVLINAIAGKAPLRLMRRVREHPASTSLLATRPSILAALDPERLSALPVGTVGRTYADFIQARAICKEELVEASMRPSEAVRPLLERDPDLEYIGTRLRDTHDLWHVLTGYGTDEPGEALLLAFTLAQTRNPGIGLIVLAAAMLGFRANKRFPVELWRAFHRGLAAELLVVQPIEAYLTRPLREVRRTLRIPSLLDAHPSGPVLADTVPLLAE